jgi:hypothetical protein
MINISVKTSVRCNFSVQYLCATARFSNQVCEIEKNNLGNPMTAFHEEILELSIACVLMSVACLESYINELFYDCEKHFPNMRPELMNKIWGFVEQKSILEKYEFALLLMGAQGFEKGNWPYQDIDVLIRLRNALMHFKPEWDSDQVVHAKVSEQLKGRFTPSSIISEGNPLFPQCWASSGCTIWLLQAIISFIYKFEELAGLDHRLKPFVDRLDKRYTLTRR